MKRRAPFGSIIPPNKNTPTGPEGAHQRVHPALCALAHILARQAAREAVAAAVHDDPADGAIPDKAPEIVQ